MALQRHSFIEFALSLVAILVGRSFGFQYLVGDSVWSIPPYSNFYNDWSSSHLFLTGDSLVFDFDIELYNLMQVTTLDYQNCRASNPIRVLPAGPATILLNEPGVFYYLCNLSDYCHLGQKISIVVHDKNSPRAPTKTPDVDPSPSSPSLMPFLTPVLSPEPSPADWNASDSPMPSGVSSEAPSATTGSGNTKSSGTGFSTLKNIGLLTKLFVCWCSCCFLVLIGP